MTDSKKKPPLNPERIVDPGSQPKTTPQWRGDLPHIYKEGCTYFVTFCLADAVPDRLKRRKKIESPEEPANIAEHYDLNPSIGDRVLGRSEIASIVESAMLYFQGDRYALSAWCVMPNHVHAVITPFEGHTLSEILHSWKSFSAHEINKTLRRTGAVWEPESFDHLVRNEHALAQFVEYTENNPTAAGLCGSPEEWPFSSARFRDSKV
jgi:REP element-mobilizing transposase RayT